MKHQGVNFSGLVLRRASWLPTLIIFLIVDLVSLGLPLSRRIAIPVVGYVLLSAILLGLVGEGGKQLLVLVAARIADARSSIGKRTWWFALGVVAAIPGSYFATLVTSGRGISASVLRIPVFAAVLATIALGAIGLVSTLIKSSYGSCGARYARSLSCLVCGLAMVAITTFHATTYLRVHLGFLSMASVVLAVGWEVAFGGIDRQRRIPIRWYVVSLAFAVMLTLTAITLSSRGAGVRSSVGLVVFSRTVAAQKLTSILFALSPIHSSAQVYSAPALLDATRLSRSNPPPVLPSQRGRYRGYHLVLVSADAFRADYLGKVEQGGSLSPNLDQIAADSVQFTEAIADFSHTSRSLVSIVSGRWDVGLNAKYGAENRGASESDRNRLQRVLRNSGYSTAAIMMGGRWGSSFFTRKNIPDFELHVQPGPACADQVARFEQLLSKLDAQRPLFTWMHLFDTHHAFQDRERRARSDEGAIASYHASVKRVDGCIGGIRAVLERRRLWQRTIFVFLADHGEALGEHGRTQRHSTCYLHDIRIPLLMRVPGAKARRIAHRVQPSDLVPTLCSLLDVNLDGELIEGDDLSGLVEHEVPPETRGMAFSRGHPTQYPCASVIDQSFHLIYTDSGKFYELYDMEQDAAEINNLVSAREDVVNRLRPVLDAYFAAGQHQERGGSENEEP